MASVASPVLEVELTQGPEEEEGLVELEPGPGLEEKREEVELAQAEEEEEDMEAGGVVKLVQRSEEGRLVELTQGPREEGGLVELESGSGRGWRRRGKW